MTRIDALLAAGPTTSFEFFPPKTPAAVAGLEEALPELVALGPSFVSVTYGALGGTRELTHDLVVRLQRQGPFPAMPHLTCIGHSEADLVELVGQYRAAGIENLLALAGDPPADGRASPGHYAYAWQLVDLVRTQGDFAVGVAAFPEVHPRSPDRATDRRHLADKLARADFAIAQFFFDPADYLRMVDELSALGCDKPILPGVFPFTSVAGLRRMAGMNGSAIPADLQERLDRVDGDPDATEELGVEVASSLGAALLAEGVPGLHLYTMNRAASVRAVCANLGLLRAGATGTSPP